MHLILCEALGRPIGFDARPQKYEPCRGHAQRTRHNHVFSKPAPFRVRFEIRVGREWIDSDSDRVMSRVTDGASSS
jgi:hypothetical protein